MSFSPTILSLLCWCLCTYSDIKLPPCIHTPMYTHTNVYTMYTHTNGPFEPGWECSFPTRISAAFDIHLHLQSVAPDLPSSSSPSIGVSRPFRNRIFWREVFRAPQGAIQSTERHRTPAAVLLLSCAQNCAQFSVLRRWEQSVNCPDQSEPDVHLVRYNWTDVHLYPNIAVLWQQSEPIMCTDSTIGWGGGDYKERSRWHSQRHWTWTPRFHLVGFYAFWCKNCTFFVEKNLVANKEGSRWQRHWTLNSWHPDFLLIRSFSIPEFFVVWGKQTLFLI